MEESNKDNILSSPEKESKIAVQFKLPADQVATIDAIATLNGQSRQDLIRDLSLWSIEDIDLQTGALPARHPNSGRTKEEVLKAPKIHGKPSSWLKR